MSNEELSQCEMMIKNLLDPDNNKRNQAQAQLQNCLSNIKNKEALSVYCSILLLKSNDLYVQTYCAIILRKIFLTSGKEISNEAVKNFSPQNKSQIQKNLILSIQSNKDQKVLKQIAEACIKVYEGLIENEEKWDEFLKYIVTLFNLELNDENIPKIELGLYILSNIFSFAYEELSNDITNFLKKIKVFFSCNSLSVKSKAVHCISELLSGTSNKKVIKSFKEFIFDILKTTKTCMDEKDQTNLKICMESIQDLVFSESKLVKKNFNDLFILMGKIIEEKSFEEKIREIGIEIIISIIEGIPSVIDDQKLKIFIQCLFKYAMELEQEIDDEWLNPNNENYIEDNLILESKLDEACDVLSRLFKVLDKKKMLQITSQNIMELIHNSSEKDWKYKYIAYISIAEIVEFIGDLSSIGELIKLILSDLYNPNLKIQFSSIYCIAELSDQKFPDFQNDYHKKVVPEIIKILAQSKCLRVQLECCDALDCFLEHITSDDSALYVKDSLEVLFQLFIKDDKECPPSLKKGILNALQQFINACEEDFKIYSDKCLQLLLKYLGEILSKNINRNLIGPLMETISTIGPLCPELFKNHLTIIVNTLIQINLNLNSFDENFANYLLSTWENIIPNLKESNSEKIPQIISSLIELLKKDPEMSISSDPNKKINIMEFFSDEKKEEESDEEKDKNELKTSETEEFSIFIEILNLFLSNCDELCTIEQMNILTPISLKLIKYPNVDIQSEISKTLSIIIEILSLKNENINTIHNNSKNFISELITQLLKETDFILITSFVDSIKDIIKSTKLFLTTQEINNLSEKILEVFDKVEKSRLALLKKKKENEEELEKNKKTGEGKINSDDEDEGKSENEEMKELNEQIDEIENVLEAFSEFFGVLFDTHKKYSLEIVEKIIKNYLPKYFKDTSSSFEKTIGLLLVDDMVEFLKQDIIGNIWDDVCGILIKYSNHPDDEVRNTACYGLGVFAQSTIQNFDKYCKNILTNLISAINIKIDENSSKDEKKTKKYARDNGVSAVGKILKYHKNELGNEYQNIMDFWINSLPINEDNEEGKICNQFLIDILMKEQNQILGEGYKNLKQIIIILSKAYNTDMSDKIMDTNIEAFANGVKNNPEFNKILVDLISNGKGTKINKVKSLFKK
jgi:hypothetical protein